MYEVALTLASEAVLQPALSRHDEPRGCLWPPQEAAVRWHRLQSRGAFRGAYRVPSPWQTAKTHEKLANSLQPLLARRLPPMPAQPTPVERLARWAALVSIHPESGHFDARRFVQDMVNRNILFTLHMVSAASLSRPRHAPHVRPRMTPLQLCRDGEHAQSRQNSKHCRLLWQRIRLGPSQICCKRGSS